MEKEIFDTIAQLLSQTNSISLAEMEGVKLMDRMEVKYTVPLHLLPNILAQCRQQYRALEIGGQKLMEYKTLYYDDAPLTHYHHHQNGRLNRYKIRHRLYNTGLAFFEIKRKNNKRRTLKTRMEEAFPQNLYLSHRTKQFLEETTGIPAHTMLPNLWVHYHRLTLVHRQAKERVTFDFKLAFADENKQAKSYEKIVIIEVKQEKTAQSPIIDILKNMNLRPGSISKYCLGMMSLYPHIKHNRFKKKYLHLLKIQHQYDLFANNRTA